MIEPGDYTSKRTGRVVTVTGTRTLVQYTTYRSGGKCVERDAESFERDYEKKLFTGTRADIVACFGSDFK